MRILFANFGAEESDAPPPPPRGPLEALIRGWERAVAIADDHGCATSGLVAWLNTERAQAEADRVGLPLFGAPVDVVTRVHDKGFCARVAAESGLLPDDLRGRVHVLEPHDVTPERTRAFEGFVAKPRSSTSGRGRVVINPGGLSERSCAKLRARGGIVVEPWLDRRQDFSTHWWVDDAGVRWLGSTRALMRGSGVWRGAQMALDLEGQVTSGNVLERAIVEISEPVVRAAAADGYRGVCGVDVFSYLPASSSSSVALRVCELNARFTAGFVGVMLAQELQAPPGSLITWWLGHEPVVTNDPDGADRL